MILLLCVVAEQNVLSCFHAPIWQQSVCLVLHHHKMQHASMFQHAWLHDGSMLAGIMDVQVTDGERVLGVDNGVEMLTLVTAAGCSVTALISAFVAAAPQDPLLATAHALAVFG